MAKNGADTYFVQVDLGDEASIKALMDETINHYGRLDLLANCAFFQVPEGQIVDTPSELWDKHFQIDLRGYFLMMKYALPHMIDAGGGAIVNVSSTASFGGEDGAAAYGACKAALNCLSKEVAVQYGDKHIRCNAVLPGTILTPQIVEYVRAVDPGTAYHFDSLLKHTPLNHYGSGEDVADAVLFLLSDKAKNITGTTLVCDGGMSAVSSTWYDMHSYKKNHDWHGIG